MFCSHLFHYEQKVTAKLAPPKSPVQAKCQRKLSVFGVFIIPKTLSLHHPRGWCQRKQGNRQKRKSSAIKSESPLACRALLFSQEIILDMPIPPSVLFATEIYTSFKRTYCILTLYKQWEPFPLSLSSLLSIMSHHRSGKLTVEVNIKRNYTTQACFKQLKYTYGLNLVP